MMATMRGGDRMRREIERIARKMGGQRELRVGFLANQTKGEGGISMPELAMVHNYGSANIPPRPFFTAFVRQAQGKLPELAERAIKHADFDEKRALNMMGLELAGDLRSQIPWQGGPPLKPETVARKKRGDTPLFETGQLLDSIDYEVK
jgi:hypothetical protein